MYDLTEWIPDLPRFSTVRWVRADHGYIVWRYGTGGNTEITHVRSLRPGGGQKLVRAMLAVLRADPPYGGNGTVFGFTRQSNQKARHWYRDMGFVLTDVEGVYAEGWAVVFSQTFAELCRIHDIQPRGE